MIHSRHLLSVELNWVKVETLKHTNQLENSRKIRWYQSYDPTVSFSCIFQRNDDKPQNKYLYTYIQSNTIPNSPRVETTQIYVNRWMDKQSMIHPHNGILFGQEKKGNSDLSNMDELWKHYARWQKPDAKGHISYDLCETSEICTSKRQEENQWWLGTGRKWGWGLTA